MAATHTIQQFVFICNSLNQLFFKIGDKIYNFSEAHAITFLEFFIGDNGMGDILYNFRISELLLDKEC